MEYPSVAISSTTITLTLSSRSSSDPVSPVISESGIYSNAKKYTFESFINIRVSPHGTLMQRTQRITENYLQKNGSVGSTEGK